MRKSNSLTVLLQLEHCLHNIKGIPRIAPEHQKARNTALVNASSTVRRRKAYSVSGTINTFVKFSRTYIYVDIVHMMIKALPVNRIAT